MSTTMTVECPSCDTAFPVDPLKVPEGGARTQCTVCQTFFRVDRPRAEGWAPPPPAPVDAGWDAPTAEADEEAAFEEPMAEAVSEEPVAEAPAMEPGAWSPGAWDAEEGDAADWDADDWDSPETELPVLEGTEVPPEAPHHDVALAEALEPAVDAVEPLEAMEAGEVEDGAGEAGDVEEAAAQAVGEAGADWAEGAGDDWVVETEDDSTFGELEVEVDRLDTVEEQLRAIQDQERYDGYLGNEVMLPAEEPGAPDGDAARAEAEPEPDVEAEWAPEPEPEVEAEWAPEPGPEPEPAPVTGFQFGRRDPHEKARRLARVLVSDMITYNPERHARALEQGTLREDFDEEIRKSWSEYVEQVGQDLADSTPYWTEALNEILARGEPLF